MWDEAFEEPVGPFGLSITFIYLEMLSPKVCTYTEFAYVY